MRPASLSKVIIEAAYLTDEEKVTACSLAKAAGADFVKTSTGFGPGGATVADVALMRRVVGHDMGVKAAGGVRDLEGLKAMVAAGASRVGASAGVKIVQESSGKAPATTTPRLSPGTRQKGPVTRRQPARASEPENLRLSRWPATWNPASSRSLMLPALCPSSAMRPSNRWIVRSACLRVARVVRDHADRRAFAVQFLQQAHHGFAVLRVQVTGRLVREQDRR